MKKTTVEKYFIAYDVERNEFFGPAVNDGHFTVNYPVKYQEDALKFNTFPDLPSEYKIMSIKKTSTYEVLGEFSLCKNQENKR